MMFCHGVKKLEHTVISVHNVCSLDTLSCIFADRSIVQWALERQRRGAHVLPWCRMPLRRYSRLDGLQEGDTEPRGSSLVIRAHQ